MSESFVLRPLVWRWPFALLQLLAVVLLFAGLPVIAAGLSAEEILAAADRVRNPQQGFALSLDLLEYREGRQSGSSRLRVFARADEDGRFRTLVQFLTPVRDEGKLMLKRANELWFYDPASRVSMRISPQQRLLGQAANGDVVTVNMAQDYTATLEGEESVLDGERRSRSCHRLQLSAASSDVSYARITLWTDVGTQHPVKAQFWADSGRLLKTVFYRRYQHQLGRERPTEMVIIDGLNPSWVTVMRYSDYQAREVPEAWLQRDYLPRFRAE